MSCLTTAGLQIKCKESIGGIKAIYLAEYADFANSATIDDTNNIIRQWIKDNPIPNKFTAPNKYSRWEENYKKYKESIKTTDPKLLKSIEDIDHQEYWSYAEIKSL